MAKQHITAMDILAAIEKDVNEDTFDVALYEHDINQLRGLVDELSLLKNTLVQLKDQLPQYSDDVDTMQQQIEKIENDRDAMVDREVEQSMRFNDGFNNLMNMIKERDPSRALRKERSNKSTEPKPESNVKPLPKKKKTDSPESKTSLKKGVLLKQLLSLVEQQWVTAADFERLPDMMGVKELAGRIFVLTEAGSLLRLIPEDMFANDETKQNIIGAAQECLDGFIEEEADAEMQGLVDVEQGFGIVGEVTADLDFVTSSMNNHNLEK